MSRPVLAVVMLAAIATAKPPRTKHFRRLPDLLAELEARYEELKREEGFPRKCREERLVLRFGQGKETFEGRRLTGRWVVDTLLRWDAARRDDPTPETRRVLALLPEALKKRYALVMPIPKGPRYEASVPLVEALTSRHGHLRATALACLEAVYGARLGYRPDLPPEDRKAKQREWKKRIRALRR